MKHNVIIVGAGALGSHVALLARNWDAKLTVIDFDRVEQKNVLAQFHTKMGMRQNKAQALAKAMQGLFGLKLHPVPHRLTEDNVAALLGRSEDDAGVMGLEGIGTTLVIDCTDNIEARMLIQGYCKPNGTPCLHGCLSADGQFMRAVWTEDFNPDPEGFEGEATCEGGEQLPFYAMAAGLIAQIAQRWLTDWIKESHQLMPGALVRLA